MNTMQKINIALCAAVLGSLAAPAEAVEYKYKNTYNAPAAFVEKNKSKLTFLDGAYAGKFFQWFGTYQVCPRQDYPCEYTLMTSRQVSTSWKFGTNVTVKNGVADVGDITSGITVEYNATETDTDTYTFKYTFAQGKTAMPATFIERGLQRYQIVGVWVRDQVKVKCPSGFPSYMWCDRYVWRPNQVAGTFSGLKRVHNQQGMTWLVWTNGQRPSEYKLEAN